MARIDMVAPRSAARPGPRAKGQPPRDKPRRPSMPSPVLVGRERELAELVLAVTDRPALAVVEGEAGVGKSRLVAELAERPELLGVRCLAGRCRPLVEPFCLGPVVEAFGALHELPQERLPAVTGALGPLLPELADQLPPAPGPSGDPQADRHVLFRAVAELLRFVGPCLLVLEDLQWADNATLELIGVLEGQATSGVALLLTWRGEEVPAGSALRMVATRRVSGLAVTRIGLEPLPVNAVAVLASSLLGGGDVGSELAERLWAWTAGIPLVLEEVLRLLVDRGDLVREGRSWRCLADAPRVPGNLRDTVLARVARLSSPGRAIAEAASVLTEPAGEDLLVAVAGISSEQGLPGLTEALRAAVVVETSPGSGSYTYRHGLAARAVYEDLPGPRRRQLHGRAARLLGAIPSPPLARMAHHLGRAGLRREAVACAEAAADQALADADEILATALLRGALEILAGASAAERSRVAAKLARVALSSPVDAAEAVTALRQLLADPELSGEERGSLRCHLGVLLAAAGDEMGAARQRQLAVGALQPGSALAVRAMAELAWPWSPEGHLDDHLHWLAEAERSASDSLDPDARLELAIGRAQVLVVAGHPAGWEAARECPWEDRRPGDAVRLACVAVTLAGACCHLGHYRRAHAFLEEARRQRRSPGDDSILVEVTTSLFLRWAEGSWEGLMDLADRHAEASGGVARFWVPARLVEGSLSVALSQRGRAERSLRAAVEVCGEGGVVPGVALGTAGLARLALSGGRPDVACEEARHGWDAVEAKGVWAWGAELAPVLVEALVAAGRPDEAERAVGAFASGSKGADAPLARSALALCRALLAEAAGDDRAADLLEAAGRSYQRLPRPYDAALASARAGQLWLARGERERGSALLGRALETLSALGARAEGRRLLDVLQGQGLATTPPARVGRPSYGSGLSPREAEVASLAAAGRTTRQIATELFVSPKTAEHHLGAAMRKLGVQRRQDIADLLTTTP